MGGGGGGGSFFSFSFYHLLGLQFGSVIPLVMQLCFLKMFSVNYFIDRVKNA